MCVHVWVYVHVWASACVLWGFGSPGVFVRGICELFDVGTGNQSWVLCKSNAYSYTELSLQSLKLI